MTIVSSDDPSIQSALSMSTLHTISLALVTPIRPEAPSIDVVSSKLAESSMARESPMSANVLSVNDHRASVEPNFKPDGLHDKALPPLPTTAHLRYGIFPSNTRKPTITAPVPESSRARIESTLQLAYCSSLLLDDPAPSNSDNNTLIPITQNEFDRRWLRAIQQDSEEQTRIRRLVSSLVAEFFKDTSRSSAAIAEVVILGPVLSRQDYRALLSCFIERFEQAALLDIELLQGMVQLVQSESPGFPIDDDMAKILRVLRERLEGTHTPSTGHVYQLVYAISKVLEVMVNGKMQDLNRERDHLPLLGILRNLRGVDDDDLLKFQVNYAYQTLLYLPDDETPLQMILRYAQLVAVGASAVASVFKLDPKNALDAVEYLQQTAGNASDVLKATIDGTRAIRETGEGVVQSFKKACQSGEKQAWYLALQAAHAFVRDGRLVEFNQLVCDAACRFDRNFQRGVCQILGEIAVNPLWNIANRHRTINFLGEIYNSADQRKDVKIKKWVVVTLRQMFAMKDVEEHARGLLKLLLKGGAIDTQEVHPLLCRLPLSSSFPLLYRALDIPSIEYDLENLRRQRLEEFLTPVFIPLQAKQDLQTSDTKSFPLKQKALKFLQSNRQVLLVLGDSGAGKSTFCRYLEHELWTSYQTGDRIPLFINLPSVDRPDDDLVVKQLRYHNFSEPKIQELKQHRQFLLICDGYDESRLSTNLYTSNRLNQPGQWDVKMIISCRSTYLHHDYQGRFRPQGADRYSDSRQDQFEEAIIVPFSFSDISSYVEHYARISSASEVSEEKPVLTADEYRGRLCIIPDMVGLVKNPFLLTLALKTVPYVLFDTNNPSVMEATRLQLYDDFIKHWIRINKERLERSTLSQETRAVFEQLLEADFGWCVTDYSKGLAEAIYHHQDGRPVVEYTHLKDNKTWRAEFFGPEIQPTLLREASPLSRAGIRHWFLHQSLLEYFYALTMYDPFDSDNDDSDDDSDDGSGSGGNDSVGGEDDSHGDGGGDGSQGGGDGSHGGGDNATQGGDDPFGGSHGFAGGSDDPPNNGDGSAGNNQGPPNQRDGFQQRKDGSDGDKDGSRQNKDTSRSKGKGTSKGRARSSTSDNPFSRRNLFKEPAVLQFLVERAQSDKRLVQRLLTTIEQSKSEIGPSLAAANAITILIKARQHLDVDLRGVRIPRDYLDEKKSGSGQSAEMYAEMFVEDLLDYFDSKVTLEVLARRQSIRDAVVATSWLDDDDTTTVDESGSTRQHTGLQPDRPEPVYHSATKASSFAQRFWAYDGTPTSKPSITRPSPSSSAPVYRPSNTSGRLLKMMPSEVKEGPKVC
ncbi:hypothetical protein BGX29_006740 [Mortierella sp. GBA35]|nr:hypothetical protein BGX29_006740 [Mortierella sp. GBA35]